MIASTSGNRRINVFERLWQGDETGSVDNRFDRAALRAVLSGVGKVIGAELTFDVGPEGPNPPRYFAGLQHLLTRKFQPLHRIAIRPSTTSKPPKAPTSPSFGNHLTFPSTTAKSPCSGRRGKILTKANLSPAPSGRLSPQSTQRKSVSSSRSKIPVSPRTGRDAD